MRVVIVIALVLLGSVARAACPSGQALAEVAAMAFPAEMRGAADPAQATCTVVHGHGAHWLLELDTGASGLLVAVTSPSGKLAWTCCGVGAGAAIAQVTPVDLDGDGNDELVIATRDAANVRTIGVESIDGKQGDAIELAAGARWRLEKQIIEVDGVRYRWKHAELEHS